MLFDEEYSVFSSVGIRAEKRLLASSYPPAHMSVCPSVSMYQRGYNWRGFFMEFYIGNVYEKFVDILQILLKSGKNFGHCV
jgi:hypothetical protein